MSNEMIFILSFIIPILAFFFEIYPRLKNRLFGVDIWTHLLYLQEYHKQKGIPKKITSGFLISGEYDYPPAFITILSKLPFHLVEKYEFLFSPFFDSLHILLMFFFVYFFTGSLFVGLLTQFLYMITPIIVLENSSATPRSLGYLLFSVVFVSLFLFQNTHAPVCIAIALLAGTSIFLSHRFTAQGFLFFSIAFSLLEKNLVFLGVFIISFFMAIIISKGFYLKVLRGHLGNLKFWYQNYTYRFSHQVKGNYTTYKTHDFVFKLYNQFLKFPPFVLAITNPWVLTAFSFVYFIPKHRSIEQQFFMWVVISYAISLTTIWIPRLRFLGEGQRYLELSAFPAAFLSAEVFVYLVHTKLRLFADAFYLSFSIAGVVTILVIQRKAIIKDKLRTITPSMQKMFVYLKSLNIKPRLLCIPHQMTTSVIYHTGCPVFVNADYTNIEKISDVYPFLRKPIKQIMRERDLDAILLNEHYAKKEELHVKKYIVIKQFDNYLLIKLR